MFCKNCGKESASGQKFCTSCGTPFSNESSVPKQPYVGDYTAGPTSSQTPPPVNRPPMPSEPWTTKKALKTIVVVAIVGIIIFYKIQTAVDNTAIDKNNSALDAYNTGNNTQAINQLQDAATNAATNDIKIATLKNLGYAYDGDGQKDMALNSFQEGLKLTSKDSFDYYLISGEIASLQNNPSIAFVNYKKAYNLKPTNFQANSALALFLMDLEGQHPEFEDYKSALIYAQNAAGQTTQEIAKQNLGMAYFLNEKYDQAISTFSSITLDKDTITALWLGLSYAGNGDVPHAKLYMQKAIDNGAEIPQEVYDYLNSH